MQNLIFSFYFSLKGKNIKKEFLNQIKIYWCKKNIKKKF